MDSVSLHLDIENSLNKTLKEAQVSMKSFNSLLENSQKNFTNISKTSDKVSDNFDDIADDTERASKHTKTWADRFSKVGSIAKRVGGLIAGGMAGLSLTGAIKDAFDLGTAMKTLSYRMGDAGETAQQLRKATYETAKATGLSIEKSTELVEGLKHYRVATDDVEKLGIATGQFSRITGVSADTATRLTGQMVRFGKLSADGAKRVLTGMAQVQRQVGLTEGEMEQISTTTIKATATLSQYGKSSAQIESFNKGISKLAGGFASVGVEAGKALEVIDSLLDPTQIEDNALLYAKLGISLQDAISGDVDPEELQRGFKNLGQELEGMSNMAAGQLAKSMGMSLRDLRAMADMGEGGKAKEGDMGTMLDEQLSVQQQLEKASNTFQVTMTQTMDNLANKLKDIFGGEEGLGGVMKKLMGFFTNKKMWIMGALALIGVMFILRKKFMGLATSFGKSLTTATSEAIAMGTEKGRIKAAAGGRSRGRRRGAETSTRVTEGADYAGMQDLAETFDVMAKSNLFPFMARMTEHTADWVRDISMGSKKTSLLTTLTDEINQKIKDRVGMRKSENSMMTERLGDLKQEKESRIAALNASIREGMSEKEKAWVGKEISKEVAKRNALQEKIHKEDENTRNLEIKAIRRMGKEEQARMMRSAQERKERLEGLRASGKLERAGLRNQDIYLKNQFSELSLERRALKEKIKAGKASTEEVMQVRKIEEAMKDIVKEREKGVALANESVARDVENAAAMKDLAKESSHFKRAVPAKLRKELEDAGKSLMPLSRTKKVLGFVGATFRKAGDNVTDAFDKAKKSAKQLGINIVEKLKPSNWIKSIKAKIRGDTEDGEKKTREEGKKNRGAMGKMGGFLGKLLPMAAIIGIGMKILQPIFSGLGEIMKTLDPVFKAFKEILAKIASKLFPPFLRLFSSLMPLFAALINKLLPPLLWLLGQVVKMVGWMLEGMADMLKGLASIPLELKTLFKMLPTVLGGIGKEGKEELIKSDRALELGVEAATRQRDIYVAGGMSKEDAKARILEEMRVAKSGGKEQLWMKKADQDIMKQLVQEEHFGAELEELKEKRMYQVSEEARKLGDDFRGAGEGIILESKKMMEPGGEILSNEAVTRIQGGLNEAADRASDPAFWLNAGKETPTAGAVGGAIPSGASAAVWRAGEGGELTKEEDARTEELSNVEATAGATTTTAENTGAALTETQITNNLLRELITKLSPNSIETPPEREASAY